MQQGSLKNNPLPKGGMRKEGWKVKEERKEGLHEGNRRKGYMKEGRKEGLYKGRPI
jgi:hypothetical protein